MQPLGILAGGIRKGLGTGWMSFRCMSAPMKFRAKLGESLGINYGRLNTSPFVTGLVVLRWPVCSWAQSLAALCFRYFCKLVNIRLHFPHWNRSGSLSSPSDSCPAKHKGVYINDHLKIAQIDLMLLSNFGDKTVRTQSKFCQVVVFPPKDDDW